MAECLFDRTLLQSHFDGECSPADSARVEEHLRSCEECDLRHALEAIEVGLFMMAAPGNATIAVGASAVGAAAGGSGHSAGTAFATRVMARIAKTPREQSGSEGPRTVDPAPRQDRSRDQAPPRERSPLDRAPLPAPAPAGRGFRIVPRLVWAGVAGGALAAAAAFVLFTHKDSEVPEIGRPSIVARGERVLRWRTAFASHIAGSEWLPLDGPTDVLPGEILHSPEGSSAHLRLPEGGRLLAGPSSWLAVGGSVGAARRGGSALPAGTENPADAALLEGGATAAAGGTRSIVVDTPSGRVTSSDNGEFEVSIRSKEGASREKGLSWLGGWSKARKAASGGVNGTSPAPISPGSEPGTAPSGSSSAPPPGTVMVVYARRGTVEVSLAAGPVRNSLERAGGTGTKPGVALNSEARRTVTIQEHQALVILETKTYVVENVDDDAPPDTAKWLDGMPVPPGSTVFRDSPAPASPPPGPIGASAGPVRNSLERALTDMAADPSSRAYALSVFAGVGGSDAVAAGVLATSDPAILVRSAAVRVLALNAWADRPAALAGLRILAADKDMGIARFAILGLKTLKDPDAVPVLRGLLVVDDDGPPEDPGIVAKVYAFDALVSLGDRSLIANAAALFTKAERDSVLTAVLRQAVFDAMEKMPRSEVRLLTNDPRPGVKAAAIQELADVDMAKAALSSEFEEVRIAAARVLLSTMRAEFLDDVGAVAWTTPAARAAIVVAASPLFRRDALLTVPNWLIDAARLSSQDGRLSSQVAEHRLFLLIRAGLTDVIDNLLASGSASEKSAVLKNTTGATRSLLALLHDSDQVVREDALYALMRSAQDGLLATDETPVFQALQDFHPVSLSEVKIVAGIYSAFARLGASELGLQRLLAMAASRTVLERRVAAVYLGTFLNRDGPSYAVAQLLSDSDREVAERASESVLIATVRSAWAGPPIASLFPSPSPFPLARVFVAAAASVSGISGADAAVYDGLAHASSRARIRFFNVFLGLNLHLQSLDPAVLSDPTPEARLAALLSLEHAALRDAARGLREDPAVWVRATAFAALALAGDDTSLAALRQLLPVLQSGTTYSARMLMPMTPDNPELPDYFIRLARIAILPGAQEVTIAYPEASLATSITEVRSRAMALSLRDVLESSSDASAKSKAARELGTRLGFGAVEVLGSYLDRNADSGSRLEAIVEDSLGQQVGFSPIEGWVSFRKNHANGLVWPLEIRASAYH